MDLAVSTISRGRGSTATAPAAKSCLTQLSITWLLIRIHPKTQHRGRVIPAETCGETIHEGANEEQNTTMIVSSATAAAALNVTVEMATMADITTGDESEAAVPTTGVTAVVTGAAIAIDGTIVTATVVDKNLLFHMPFFFPNVEFNAHASERVGTVM